MSFANICKLFHSLLNSRITDVTYVKFAFQNMSGLIRNNIFSRIVWSSVSSKLNSPYCTNVAAAPSKPSIAEASPAPEKDKLFSKLEIELRGIDPAVLKSYSWFATTAASHLGIKVGNCYAPRKAHHDRLTLLKSVHIYKKHRVQYEVRTHFRFMNFHKLTGSTMDTFLEYIERNLPEGVALYATKTELQEIPEHLKQPPSEI